MARVPKQSGPGIPRVVLRHKANNAGQTSLLITRMRELDHEFARQTKQLSSVTKQLRKRVSKRLLPRKKV